MASPYTLPKDFLAGPPPALQKRKVNFRKAGLPEYDGMYAVVLDGVMTEEECGQLVAAAEATTNGEWERALINIGWGVQALSEETRKCGRIIWDNRELMAKVWARVEGAVPEVHRIKDWPAVTGDGSRKITWAATRLNERARFLKYVGGEYFKEHCDGMYETPTGTERSYFTMHLYLNDTADKDGGVMLEGGATSFHSWEMDHSIKIEPKCGRVLLFQQNDLLHSGDDVVKGTKFTMRTDLMYAVDGGPGEEPEGGW